MDGAAALAVLLKGADHLAARLRQVAAGREQAASAEVAGASMGEAVAALLAGGGAMGLDLAAYVVRFHAEAIQGGAIKRGSSDSGAGGGKTAGPVTSEQIAMLVSNLGLLERIDSTEIDRIFPFIERLNSGAIVDSLKAIIEVSLAELRRPVEPCIFSLTKIVKIS